MVMDGWRIKQTEPGRMEACTGEKQKLFTKRIQLSFVGS